MRLAVLAQIAAILALMSPAMGPILEPGRPNDLFRAEVLVHHGLGLAVVLLWAYINLVFLGRIKARLPPRRAMQAAAGFWAASLIYGISHLPEALLLSCCPRMISSMAQEASCDQQEPCSFLFAILTPATGSPGL